MYALISKKKRSKFNAAEKHYFYFVSIFAKKTNSMFIVLLNFKHCVIFLFKMAKKINQRAAFDAAEPEKQNISFLA